jgi:electron transfer flavoprotein-quinone oxidoreductase
VRKVDAIVVGAGPAGVSAALALARRGAEVVLLERGETPGSKNMFGGMMVACSAPEELLPGFWQHAPWERQVVKRVLTVVGERSATSVAYHADGSSDAAVQPSNGPGGRPVGGSAAIARPGSAGALVGAGLTLFRPRFDRWYAEQAREAGVTLLTSCLVDGLVMRDGRVAGVHVARPDGVLEAPVVVLCDGTLSLLAKEAGLHRGFRPEHLALGVRAIYRLPEEQIAERFGLVGRQGATQEFLGCTEGVRGGGFIYTQTETLAVGVVLHLDSLKRRGLAPYDLLDRFVASPYVAPLVKGGRMVEYSAHLLPEGGLKMVPRLSAAGVLVAGDAAALCYTNGLAQEGMNLAMTSGKLAGEVAADAIDAGDVSAAGLAVYDERLRESFVLRDMKTYDRAVHLLHRDRIFSAYPKMVGALMDGLYRSDGTPKQRLRKLGRAALEGRVALRELVGDLIEAGRSYL